MSFKQPAEKSSQLVDQAADSTEQAIHSAQQAANNALESLADAIQDLRRQTSPLLARTSEQANAMTRHGLDNVRETAHQLRLKAEHASENTVEYIRHEPVKSVLIAAATGAALMALINLISHSRERD